MIPTFIEKLTPNMQENIAKKVKSKNENLRFNNLIIY